MDDRQWCFGVIHRPSSIVYRLKTDKCFGQIPNRGENRGKEREAAGNGDAENFANQIGNALLL